MQRSTLFESGMNMQSTSSSVSCQILKRLASPETSSTARNRVPLSHSSVSSLALSPPVAAPPFGDAAPPSGAAVPATPAPPPGLASTAPPSAWPPAARTGFASSDEHEAISRTAVPNVEVSHNGRRSIARYSVSMVKSSMSAGATVVVA